MLDLGPEIAGMVHAQSHSRSRPVFGPVHNHIDRPGTVFILEGTITDHRHGIATDYGPGVGWPEAQHGPLAGKPGSGNRGSQISCVILLRRPDA
ncbi:hypothetical protein ACT9TT_22560 [Enterobacter ludwigii]|uniref:hypothetical protein n=1 Tax=Enterobacter ludwigii TaxID=299767 RepID=UPI004046F8C7